MRAGRLSYVQSREPEEIVRDSDVVSVLTTKFPVAAVELRKEKYSGSPLVGSVPALVFTEIVKALLATLNERDKLVWDAPRYCTELRELFSRWKLVPS
jgi:hypothetical protein